MKKVIALVLAAIILASLLSFTVAENGLLATQGDLASSEQVVSLKVSEYSYDGKLLSGKIVGDVPAGKIGGVTITLFLSGNRYVKTTMKVTDGEFEYIFSEPAEYITMVPVTFTRLSDTASRVSYYNGAVGYLVK